MNKTELKNLLFETFEIRLNALVKKIKDCQNELAQDVEKFREEYGNIGIAALGSLALPLIKPVITLPAKKNGRKDAESAVVVPVSIKPEKTVRRKRRKNRSGINISALLLEKLPEVVKVLGKDGKEFTSRQTFDYLSENKLVPSAVKAAHVSLALSQRGSAFGIKAVKRMAGDPIPKPTNFFFLSAKRQAKK